MGIWLLKILGFGLLMVFSYAIGSFIGYTHGMEDTTEYGLYTEDDFEE